MQYSEYSECTYVALNEAWTSASTVMTLCWIFLGISDTQSRQNSKQHDNKYWPYTTMRINVSTTHNPILKMQRLTEIGKILVPYYTLWMPVARK